MEKQSLDELANTLGQVTLDEVEVEPTAPRAGQRQGLVVDGAGDSEVTIKPREKPEDAGHRRWLEKAKAIFGMVLFVVAVGIATCMVFLHSNPDVQKIGAGIITVALSAAAGFLARGSK